MGHDTADCIAHEMMEDLSLSAEEAELIAVKIKQEIGRMAGEHANQQERPPSAGGGGGAAAANGDAAADALSRLSTADLGAIQNAAAAAVVAVASVAAATNGGAGAGAPPALPALARPALARQASGQSRSGPLTPKCGSGRPPSLHDIVRAMRDFNAQQLEEAAAAGAASAQAGGGGGGGSGGGGAAEGKGAAGAPLEVVLPAGHDLDAGTLSRVATAAASAAAQQLAEASAAPAPFSGQLP
jgi:hypothetical protein